ncbi:unnamed protein product [Arabis nemorensis]|uniref:PGG domain-containing protein n=1 Tax=Arabis nemorensis TaxID=586526 RepID=A0A565C0K7_9BRAS|nr:unnamed protein product [Arabis nemorensis]
MARDVKSVFLAANPLAFLISFFHLMDSSEAVLDIIEPQRSTVEQRKRIYFPMNLINNSARTLCLGGGDGATLPTRKSFPESLTNLRFSELYNLPGEAVAMSPEIFSEMRDGNGKFLDKLRSHTTPMVCFKTDKGDTVLHLAASLGHLELVKSIVSECPSLLLEVNWKGRLPLHVAARAGQLAVVKALVEAVTYFSARMSEEDRGLNLYVLKDINGDTALNLALKDLHEKTELLMYQKRFRYQPSMFPRVRTISFSDASTHMMGTASWLVNANQGASLLANKDGISPLYLAVKSGNVSLVSEMLKHSGEVQGNTSNLASQLEGRKSLIHAALKAKNKDVLKVILDEDPSLVHERDEEGRTCLSVGASVGFYDGIKNLLELSTSNVFECDDDGSFPIHMAMEKGHRKVVKEILKRCPASKMLLNKQGQNILHIAAKSGKARSFRLPDIKRLDADNYLIQEQDVDGNTPLHLATIMWRPRTVSYITIVASKKTRILHIQNKDGLRPLDIAELKLQSDYVLRERLTLMVLLCVYKPRGVGWLPTSGMTLRSRSEHLDATKYKDSVSALLLVATLIATVAVAAGFTMPGGFNSSAPNLGMSVLANDSTLSYFLFFDTVAMQSSVIAIVALIWAQLGDPELIHGAFHLALPSLFVALFSMASAFLSGVLATIKQNRELTNVIIVISSIFYFVVFCLLAPYVIPQVLSIRLVQQLTDVYLGLLVWFVNEDDDTHTRVKKVKSVEQVEKPKVL